MFLLSSLAGETHPLLLFVLGRTTYAQVFGDDNLRINHTVIFESIISFKEGDFEDNKALSPMFLLGYSCQRRASRRKAQEISQKNNSNN